MDEDTVGKWIRLKRYEQPEEGYFDDFLREFHHRQRRELLQRSSVSLLIERLNTYLADPRSQGWAFAPVLAAFLCAFYIIIGMTEESPLPEMPSLTQVQDAVRGGYLEPADISPIAWRGPVTLVGQTSLMPELPESSVWEKRSTEFFGEGIRLNLPEAGFITPRVDEVAY